MMHMTVDAAGVSPIRAVICLKSLRSSQARPIRGSSTELFIYQVPYTSQGISPVNKPHLTKAMNDSKSAHNVSHSAPSASPPSYPPYTTALDAPAALQLRVAPQLPQTTQTAAQIGEQYRSELYARCAQGLHERTTKYGMCGIITAAVCFPLGLIALFMDTEEICARCGVRLSK